jgi:hypothetical protein
MQQGSTIVECGCGAHYERREVRLPIKDIGLFDCRACGARLEVWSGRTVPVFIAIALPEPAAKRA